MLLNCFNHDSVAIDAGFSYYYRSMQPLDGMVKACPAVQPSSDLARGIPRDFWYASGSLLVNSLSAGQVRTIAHECTWHMLHNAFIPAPSDRISNKLGSLQVSGPKCVQQYDCVSHVHAFFAVQPAAHSRVTISTSSTHCFVSCPCQVLYKLS